jgi:hypothetical protein
MQQGNNTDEAEASIPTENERNGGRKMSLRHKFSNLLCHFGPFFQMLLQLPAPQDDNDDALPAAKK